MDPSTLIGLVVAFGALFGMITLEGAQVQSLLLPPPMLLVFGGTIAVGLAGSTIKDVVLALKALPGAIKGKTTPPHDSIEQIVSLAEKARSEGLLALEQEASKVNDPFLRGALQSIADGTDGDELRYMLEDEISTKIKTDHGASKFFTTMGGYAPTVGIIGTVVSLTHVLENLSSPEKLGPMIASAFVATLWGLLSANFIWLPIGTRMARISEIEVERMTLLMEGVLAVQAGSQPLLLRERLKAMVPAHQMKSAGKAGEAKASKAGPKSKEAA